MLYNRLTTEELERRVYIEPGNAAAAAEMLRRVPGLVDQQDDDLVEANERVDQLEKDLDRKADELEKVEEQLGNMDDDLATANSKIQDLEERIAELTFSGDLV